MDSIDIICPHQNECPLKSDEELVELVIGNKQCYICLMQRYEEKIKRYITRISGVSSDTADDIVQNVFLKVYINLQEFNSQLKFSSWLYRIAHNETINYWRRNKNLKANRVSWDDNEGLKNIIRDDYNVEDHIFQKLTNEKLASAISDLDEKYRNVIVLNYLEGKSYQEIAEVLDKPIGTVGTLISRAKKMLSRKLQDNGIDISVALRQS